MEERDLEMKDNGSISTETINESSVFKCKRKKLPCCPDSSSGDKNNSVPIPLTVTPESQTNTSSKIEPGNEMKPDHSYSKDIGDDGHYYECVICDLRGNLLCCDSCPRTYHLQCLDPPLKRIPTGTWHCPNCLLERDSLESMNDMDPISILARTKISVGKSKTGLKSVGLDKKSQISGGSILGKKNECLPVLDAATGKSRKRKKKVHTGESQKSRKTGKDKCTANTCRGRRSKTDSTCPGTSKSRQKRKTKTDVGPENEDIQLKDEILSEEARHPSDELHADHVLRDFQQVERVLGCRVQRNETNTEGAQNIVSHSEAEKCIMNDIKVDKVYVYRRSVSKTSREFSAAKGKIQGNSSATTEGLGERIGTISTGENIDLNLINLADNEASKNCEIPTKMAGIEMKTNSGSGKTEDPMVAESVSEEKVSYEFLVKWVRKSHIHNSWISELELKVLAKRKLDNYKSKYGTTVINICEEQWKLPQRVIALKSSISGSTEAFVKWTGLPYDECTWERIDEPIIAKSSHLIDLFNQFENRALEKDASKEDAPRGKGDLVPLVEQPKAMVGGSLFPHQLEALNWLRKCWFKSRNVILADEMGLGKTVSACAFLSSLYFEFKAKLPCLVLVPLSTMPNWMAESALWAPNLNVVEYHGSAKARASIRQYEWHANKKTSSYKFNVLLTTYEMVLANSTHLRGVPWEVLVVDEGHRLKNASSKLFSLLNSFSFQHRVLLTGTPLQNNIGEMYNLLNFLQPSSFPSLLSFEEKFNDLTTAEKTEELKKLVAPHMLRRLKKDAMQNIPPKTERIVPVELSSIQAEYYRAMLTKNYHILRNIGKGVAQQSMLNIVMQLRKVCNHPYLIQGTEPESGSVEFLHEMRIKASAKLTLLHSMLKVLYKEGHRVLIFSQMTKLLDILEDYLTVEFGLDAYERVDGSVSVADRQTAITRFNQDKTRFVFLLSTRSCGLGINLATADTVIIYDSDFNPHADIQAMNRAHRIGQSSRLLVYRLVVRASVEERILQLAKKKLMLDQLFVGKSGSQKEEEDILRWGTEELFTDENHRNKDEAVGDVEHKRRRRPGGLGDVYEDKCTGGTNKIVWDENAIIKLLDRSNLHSGDNTEGNLENDLLGSVKSAEWNDKPTEEQLATESLAVVTNDTCAQNSEKQEDNLGGVTEENEWDRLLRVRWEKYQNDEEGALGRGKRQKKPVYRDEYAILPYGILSEGGADKELEPEPEPEYTPAGRALKIKFAKLRARQKERLAHINAIKASGPTDQPSGPGPFSQLPLSHDRDGTQMDGSDQLIGEKAPKIKNDSKSFRYLSSRDVLPVLALCAPSPHSLEVKGSDRLKNYHSTPSNFQEKMALPNYQFPLTIVPHPQPNLFPSSSLGPRVGDSKYSIQELPALPQLPHFKFAHYQQEREVPPMWGLGHNGPTFSLFPQSHRKVLENIMMRTGSGSGSGSNIRHKKKSVKEVWSENELDFLWIGIRRHGWGNWDKMLQDPSLKFSKFRTVEDLSARWEEEQLTLLDEPVLRVKKPSKPKKSTNFSQFPNITDGTTARAFHGSRFAGPPKFQPHLTDMKLGFGDGSSTGPSGRPELPSSDIHIEQPLPRKSFGTSNSGSLGFNSSALQQNEEEQRATVKSLDILHASYNNKGKSISHSKGNEEVGESNKLPHWLREAVSAPAQTLVPDLPPTISVIARSIRLLYGDKKKPAIPPFTAPGPPPSLPKDPRPSLKKKRQKSHTFHQVVPDATSKNLQRSLPCDNAASTSVLLGPQICLARKPLTASSGLPWIEPDINMPPLGLNTVNLSNTSLWGPHPGEKLDQSESGDSSKTQLDPARCDVPDVEEISKEAVSDHHVNDNEPLP